MHFPKFILFRCRLRRLCCKSSFVIDAHQWEDATNHSHLIWMFFQQLIDRFLKLSTSDVLIITVLRDCEDRVLRAAHMIAGAFWRKERWSIRAWRGGDLNGCAGGRGRNE